MRAVLHRHGLACPGEARKQFCPSQTGLGVPGQTVKAANTRLEPMFQGCPLPALGKDQDPESQFAENNRVNREIRLVSSKPSDHARIRRRLGGFAQVQVRYRLTRVASSGELTYCALTYLVLAQESSLKPKAPAIMIPMKSVATVLAFLAAIGSAYAQESGASEWCYAREDDRLHGKIHDRFTLTGAPTSPRPAS
jgi:hypothetical protein